jgi:uncharacterized integral membrane protein
VASDYQRYAPSFFTRSTHLAGGSMYLRTVLILLVLGVLTVFTAVNWSVITEPTSLSLIIGTVQAPLGLILLGSILLLTTLFLVYIAYLQSSVLLESRRYARELQAQRELAEQAESSRLRELRAFLETQLQNMSRQTEGCKTELSARIDRLERDTRSVIEQTENSLTAYLGEIDDLLQRVAGESAAGKPSGALGDRQK